MEIPEVTAPYSITFHFLGRYKEMVRHLISVFYNLATNQPDFTCISHYRQGCEHIFRIEATAKISDNVKHQIRSLLKNSLMINFISETETTAKEIL